MGFRPRPRGFGTGLSNRQPANFQHHLVNERLLVPVAGLEPLVNPRGERDCEASSKAFHEERDRLMGAE
jgi:hypothetical protein